MRAYVRQQNVKLGFLHSANKALSPIGMMLICTLVQLMYLAGKIIERQISTVLTYLPAGSYVRRDDIHK